MTSKTPDNIEGTCDIDHVVGKVYWIELKFADEYYIAYTTDQEYLRRLRKYFPNVVFFDNYWNAWAYMLRCKREGCD